MPGDLTVVLADVLVIIVVEAVAAAAAGGCVRETFEIRLESACAFGSTILLRIGWDVDDVWCWLNDEIEAGRWSAGLVIVLAIWVL